MLLPNDPGVRKTDYFSQMTFENSLPFQRCTEIANSAMSGTPYLTASSFGVFFLVREDSLRSLERGEVSFALPKTSESRIYATKA